MSTSTEFHTQPARVRRPDRVTGAFLLLGGAAFVAGGATHPSDSGEGSKVSQLHEMLVNPMWYPSHALLLAAMACFAAAVLALRQRGGLGAGMAKLTGFVSVIAVVATLGMTLHLFAATEAAAIAGGDKTLRYHLHFWSETIINPLWGLAVAALAVVGGLTRTIGNRITLALGLSGGLAFALATATIAFTDRFEPLFPVASLLGVWGVVAGLMAMLRRPQGASSASAAKYPPAESPAS